MVNPISAFSAARLGIQWSLQRLDAAAGRIARAGLADVPPTPPPAADPEPGAVAESPVDLPREMVEVLLAQRAFSANLRVLETAGEMSKEIVNLGRGSNRT